MEGGDDKNPLPFSLESNKVTFVPFCSGVGRIPAPDMHKREHGSLMFSSRLFCRLPLWECAASVRFDFFLCKAWTGGFLGGEEYMQLFSSLSLCCLLIRFFVRRGSAPLAIRCLVFIIMMYGTMTRVETMSEKDC